MSLLRNAAKNSNSITKAKEFALWFDFSDVSRNSILGKNREVMSMFNKGSYPLIGFEEYNDTFLNYTTISQNCLNSLPYLVVPFGGKYYLTLGNQSFASKNITRINANPNLTFSMAFTALIKCPATSTNPTVFLHLDSGAGSSRCKLHLPWSDGNVLFDMHGSSYRVQIPYANTGWADTWCIISGYYIVGLIPSQVSAGFRTNGTDLTTGVTASTTITEATGVWTSSSLFAQGDGGAPWNGSVAEFMLYSPSSLDDIYKAEGYLANKWGFSGSLSAAHPYKASPPVNYPSDATVDFITTQINPNYNGFLNLNSFPSTVVAYSMRWLDRNYRGACLQLRRDSDNVVVDLRFNTTTGLLDLSNTYAVGSTTSLGQTAAQFIGSGNGSVVKWYDQSGNNRHWTQVGTTSFPKLYRNGALQMLNNKPSINWLTTENVVTPTLDILIGTNGYSVVNRQQLGATKSRTINSYANNAGYFSWSGNATNSTTPYVYWNGNPNSFSVQTAAPATTNICNYGVSHSSTSLQEYFNGTTSGSAFVNPNTTAPGQFVFNGVGSWGSEPSIVTHSEFIVFNKSLIASQHLIWSTSVSTDL